MDGSNLVYQEEAQADPDLALQGHSPAPAKRQRKGAKALLFGAYTFLIVWGMAYLVLFFTDRLPI